MDRIVLIGFMASGKSTVGRKLAELLGWRFLDFDEEIERRTGRSVPQIFQESGEPEFRRLEAALTAEVAALDRLVLAPGGGWITQPGLRALLPSGSLLVWLRISAAEAVRRARRAPTHRPLLAGPDPLGLAQALLREREPFYRLAHAVVDVDGRDPDEIARQIVEMVKDEWRSGRSAARGW
ncbi:MAG: shikimate kinase [Gemmatimonadetes bacterium]|nr:shikimate kinase [Gemmatimonadota bacterium]